MAMALSFCPKKESSSREALDRINEQFRQKRLSQISHATRFKRFLVSGFIVDRCHEYHGQATAR
jgi:hypothetical protein